jgi:hypothetical protein
VIWTREYPTPQAFTGKLGLDHEEQSCVEIHYVGPRRDVYESLRDLLAEKTRPGRIRGEDR